jgi:hypothetical protein
MINYPCLMLSHVVSVFVTLLTVHGESTCCVVCVQSEVALPRELSAVYTVNISYIIYIS